MKTLCCRSVVHPTPIVACDPTNLRAVIRKGGKPEIARNSRSGL